MNPTGANAEQLLLTEAEAASLLRISPRTLRQLRATGQIAYVRIGARRVVYTPEDVSDFIERNRKFEPEARPPVSKRALRPVRHIVPFSQRKRS